ncbi:uncharacterized protein N7498_006811 [Penicillium cinerascens]|uniref:Uncharacterized protein n=1 Tax=Penicillium cinerascens TaxID=70096 RepID=A0A9W9MIV1_9EURO|nr:uncharacterized protein N7498_006811 [Penicillium cinerascens]KAJ5202148.1 hypothetical protein N7498_006811 [Penicillium cinerascens]
MQSTAETPAGKDHERRSRGELLQRWIGGASSDTAEECPILPCTLEYEDFDTWDYFGSGLPYDTGYEQDATEALGIERPKPDSWEVVVLEKWDPEAAASGTLYMKGPYDGKLLVWEGSIAAGIVFVSMIHRRPEVGPEVVPWSSQMIHAVYKRRYPLDSLKHIIVADVTNKDTKRVVKKELYTASNGLHWPDEQLREWKYDSAEYKALLGTRIGAVVAYFVLGAFKRETCRISQIVTCFYFMNLHMRFDLEQIEPARDNTGLPSSDESVQPAQHKMKSAPDPISDLQGKSCPSKPRKDRIRGTATARRRGRSSENQAREDGNGRKKRERKDTEDEPPREKRRSKRRKI